MNRLKFGMLPVCALLLLAGCGEEPTEPLREGVTLRAEPSQLFLSPGQSKSVEVSGEDNQGNPLSLNFEVTETGPGITVRRDSTFLPVYIDDSTLAAPETAARFRFVVSAAAFGSGGETFPASSFKVVAGGDSVTVGVNVAPIGTLDATFDTQTPALGATVTITAPPGITFAEDATLVMNGGDGLQPVIVSQTSNTITFFVPPGVGGPVTVDGVFTASAPGVKLEPTTTLAVTGVALDSLAATFSNPTPAIGETVTLTLPPLIKFQREVLDTLGTLAQSAVTFPGQVAAPAAITVALDSSSLTFEAPPNAAGPARIDSLVFPGGYVFSLPTATGITAPSIGTEVDVNFSNAAPALGELVTATAPAQFRFTADGPTILFGTVVGAVQSVSADSTQVDFIPLPGANSSAVIDGLRYTPAPQFLIALPTVDTLRTEALVPLPNADDIATAPAIAVPAPGGTTTLFDAGPYNGPSDCCFGGPTRLYRVDVTEAMTLTGTVDWYEGQDLGWYWVAADGITPIGDFSGDAGGAGAHPESETIALTPGTYFAAIANFSGVDPGLIKLDLTRAP